MNVPDERLYRVEVKGGGSFLYDTIDVGRFALRMAEERDKRPFTVMPVQPVERPRDAEAVERVALALHADADCCDTPYDCADWPKHQLRARVAVAALGPVERPDEVTDASGAALIAAERERQIAAEGWAPEHDDTHDGGELAIAALCYADPRNVVQPVGQRIVPPIRWPWAPGYWKPTSRVRMLVKAGALIAAEIDRLQRAALGAVEGEPDGG